MGKSDSYKGTILDGLSKLEIWDKDLNNDLAASRLRGYITGTKTMPQRKTFELAAAQVTPLPSSDNEDGTAGSSTMGGEAMQKLSVDARYSEAMDTWDYEVAIVSKKISQSVDEAHRKSIVYLTNPKEMYESLKGRYTRKNRARLYDLIREIGDIRSMKDTPVQEKADSLQRINAQIKLQDPDMAYNDSQLIADLIESMDRDDYDTTIKILMMSSGADVNKKLEWEEVLRALQSRETELSRETQEESANYVGKDKCKGLNRRHGGHGGRGGASKGTNKPERGPGSEIWTGCFTCEGDHYQEDCPEWRQTTRGKAWLKSELGKAKLEKERVASQWNHRKGKGRKAKQDKVAKVTEASDSESDKSTCPLPNERAMTIRRTDDHLVRTQWHLDTCASSHITGQRDQFIGDLRPVRRQVQCANGDFMTAKGIGNVLIQSLHGHEPRSIVIKGVLYAPKTSENLISVGTLERRQGIEVTSSNGRQTLRKNGRVVMTGRTVGNLWQVQHPDKSLSAMAKPSKQQEPAKEDEPVVALEKKLEPPELWHARLGHPGKHMAARLNTIVEDLGTQSFCPPFCNACTRGKMTRDPSREPMKKVTQKLECVHMDLMGPVEGSLQGKRYMLTITDQFTGYVWTSFISNKKKVVETIKSWSLKAEKECKEQSKGETIRRIRFDRGREFLNNATKDWAEARGTKLEPTVGYHSEANGVSERCNRTVMERAAAMRLAVGLPETYWELSCRAATYLRNRGVVTGKEATPWEAWCGEKPRISHLRVWGCPAFVHIPKEKRNKLASRAWEGVFVGYKEDTTKLWEIWDPKSRRLVDARFVVFNETKTGVTNSNLHENKIEDGDETYLEESDSESGDGDEEQVKEDALEPLGKDNVSPQPSSREFTGDNSIGPIDGAGDRDEAGDTQEIGSGHHHNEDQDLQQGSDSNPEDTITVQLPESPRRRAEDVLGAGQQKLDPAERRAAKQLAEKARKEAIRREASARRLANRGETRRIGRALKVCAVLQEDPRDPKSLSYEEAMNGPDADEWKKAVDAEVKSIQKRRTFSGEIEKPPPGETVTAKLVFDTKVENGKVTKYKARLVARGFSQKHRINYEETFAPTMRLDALRILLAIAAKKGWKIHQMDVVSAFLAGKLKEKIFMKVPEPLVGIFGRYVRILKSLYGLKQAARVWYLLLSSFFESIGFKSLPTDPSIMINRANGVIVGIHVDDMVLTGGNKEAIADVKRKLQAKFEMKDLGEARNIVGLRVTRDLIKGAVSIDQTEYATEIIKEFLFDDGKTYSTPMDPQTIRSLHETPGRELTDEEETAYIRLIGKLQYLCNTRPDIVLAVSRLGSFTQSACHNHWKALIRVVGYIKGTLTLGIIYGEDRRACEGVQPLEYYDVEHNIEAHAGTSPMSDTLAFSDSDHAADPRDRKSIKGFVFMVYGGAVSFSSCKLKSVARSTAEAEYIALSDAAKQAIWTRKIVAMIEGQEENEANPVPILFGDNKGAIQLTRGLSNTSKIKHVDTAFHHVVDEVKQGSIKIYWIPGKMMLADGFTKALPRDAFERNRKAIGMRKIEAE
jgi:Reverse transcriptase (RNA-dependent DNA polymerase)/gag-polypeptide of LTR copia-type